MVRGILFDLDGVLYNSNQGIEGAVAAVDWVQANGIPHLFVTNTTSRPRFALVQKLHGFGFRHATEEQILTPAAAASEWLRQQKGSTAALFIRAESRTDFAGIPQVSDDAEAGADFVVVGDLGELWDFRTLNRAFRLMHHNPEAGLIALGMTRYWRSDNGVSLDVAPFVAALECATGRKAVVIGKPSPQFFQAAIDKLGLTAGEVVMVGDDVVTDVGGAQEAGLKGVLVKTGKFRPQDLEGSVKPFAVLDSVVDLPSLWMELKANHRE
jgi:HAD superfamily hydrolase (TIGR01458 family)